MTSVKYIGLDVHKESISICVRNSVGKVVMESVVETKASTILQFIDGLRGDLRGTFEEGTWAAWLYDLLKPHVSGVEELPVDSCCNHRWDFPCWVWSPVLHAVANTPAGLMGTCSLIRCHQLRPSPKPGRVGSCISRFEACSAFTHVGFSSLVASTAALIATGWNEQVPGRRV